MEEYQSAMRLFTDFDTIDARLGEQSIMIQALSMPYKNVYAVNIRTAETVCYRMGRTMSERYGQRFALGNYEENICAYINNDVLEEDRHLFDRVRSVAGVERILEENKTYSFNYRVFRNLSPERSS